MIKPQLELKSQAIEDAVRDYDKKLVQAISITKCCNESTQYSRV